MRVVLVNIYFSERMGYADAGLARALAGLGHEVHLVVSDGRPYFDGPEYATTYQSFLGPPLAPCGTSSLDGYTLHRLPHARLGRRLRLRGLVSRVAALRADVVQTFSAWSHPTTELALARPLLGYQLFLACHIHASVFPPARGEASPRARAGWAAYGATLGRVVGANSARCYAISPDAAQIARDWFSIPAGKVVVMPLGVDADVFRPAEGDPSLEAERAATRRELGVLPEEVLCIYTGRFSPGKDPRCLARAVGVLRREGLPWRGLFVGNGTEQEVAAIQAEPGCTVHSFVEASALARFYRAADVGVWPRQESTSQVDAAACGLPLVISDRTEVPERIEGNGFTYLEGDSDDLARVLRRLGPADERRRMGLLGAARVRSQLAWTRLARRRLDDYRAALAGELLPNSSR